MRVTSCGPTIKGACRVLEGVVAARVVGVPVRVEDEIQPPTLAIQRRQYGLGVRRVDAGDEAGGLVADEKAVVVGQTGKLGDLQGS